MLRLPIDHPDVQKHFEEGLHVIHRSNEFWSGLSPELAIKQVLMRSLKTNGGLTRGSGFEEQRDLYGYYYDLFVVKSITLCNNLQMSITI